ncbi:MAG: hypothetical protein ACE14M_07835 [Terriglobales bacterium]
MARLHGRALMESRFGPLGCGGQTLVLNGAEYDLAALMSQLGLEFDDAKPIDVQSCDGHYVMRYFDAQDARVVAYEFDAGFHQIEEHRAHIAEWVGEEAYFSFYAGH